MTFSFLCYFLMFFCTLLPKHFSRYIFYIMKLLHFLYFTFRLLRNMFLSTCNVPLREK